MAERLFMTGVGIELANRFGPIVRELVIPGTHPLDVLNGIGVTLTRALGQCERAVPGDENYVGNEQLQQWVREYVVFLAGRFGGVDFEEGNKWPAS